VGKATLNFRTRSELGGEKSRIVETKYQIQRIAWQTAILHRHEAPMTGFRLSLLFSGLLCMTLPGQFLAQASLDETLRPFLAKYEMPAVAVAVVQEGKIIALGAVGTRQVGTNTSVTPTDRWHIGSDGKAMTALLAAMLVEEGKLRWTSTLPDIFPELTEKMTPSLRKATLEQFLCHTSGVRAEVDYSPLFDQATLRDTDTLVEQRLWVVQEASRLPLGAEPGVKWAYSNVGYVMAGAMMERVSGKSWEQLMVERIFTPLDFRSAGFGPQTSVGRLDAPAGHMMVNGKLKAFAGGPSSDNPMTAAPAGTAHMSVLDFAKWAGWNAGAGKRGPKLVSNESLKKLHTPVASTGSRENAPPGTPPAGNYGYGWGDLKPDYMTESLLYHGGSNGKNLAHIYVDLKNDRAMVLVTNIAGKQADAGLKAIAKEMYQKYMTSTASR
jgi:CubicO group peptidase (beta-lactamase class C family)